MLLLQCKYSHNVGQHIMKGFRKYPVNPRGFPVSIGQIKRGAQRIHLVLAFPHVVILLRFILIPRSAVCALVKSIGIGINTDQTGLFFNNPLQDRLQFPILLRKPHIGPYLCRRIPQPHGGNIAGNHKITAVLKLLNRSLDGV